MLTFQLGTALLVESRCHFFRSHALVWSIFRRCAVAWRVEGAHIPAGIRALARGVLATFSDGVLPWLGIVLRAGASLTFRLKQDQLHGGVVPLTWWESSCNRFWPGSQATAELCAVQENAVTTRTFGSTFSFWQVRCSNVRTVSSGAGDLKPGCLHG